MSCSIAFVSTFALIPSNPRRVRQLKRRPSWRWAALPAAAGFGRWGRAAGGLWRRGLFWRRGLCWRRVRSAAEGATMRRGDGAPRRRPPSSAPARSTRPARRSGSSCGATAAPAVAARRGTAPAPELSAPRPAPPAPPRRHGRPTPSARRHPSVA
eukprot:tig00020531_g10042.t2